ncbi:Six-hairpin glycosidase [Obba rivulosa]|uniref:Six-hairpin glycosidase n=1 Tax=Obba rivulosa TaxID=1052685 RepID=A0A8E2DJP0_9APHY|nr:Six-hairpin glycosidase [Obba rivulosa]
MERSGGQTLARIRVALLMSLAVLAFARAQNLTNDQLNAVKSNLIQGAKQSWELGTESEALTEFDTASYSVVNGSSVPPPLGSAPSSLGEVLAIAKNVVSNLTISSSSPDTPQPLDLPSGGAAGDSASLGFAVLLANWTGQGATDGLNYAAAATAQLNWTLTVVPRTSDGAISHRIEQVQLWSDSMYMVPPFLAYYGALNNNQSLLQEAHDQISLYRNYMRDTSAGGLWKHILMGNQSQVDEGHWSTGNAWAAGGMIRVLSTIQHSQFSGKMKNQVKDLISWTSEIHNAMYPHLTSDMLFTNYADDNSTFLDAASTAMLASTVYRLALLGGVHTHVPLAEQCRRAISAPLNSTNGGNSAPALQRRQAASATASGPSSHASSAASSGSSRASSGSASPTSSSAPAPTQSLLHFDGEMWLTPVPNPDSWTVAGQHSPESQAFVVEMYAAWRDWVDAGAPGANGARAVRVGVAGVLGSLAVGVWTALGWW